MAKSLRSKKMRKLRAFKRIRYGEKELERLKNMLASASLNESTNDVKSEDDNKNSCEEMVCDDKAIKTYDNPPKYPCWLSHFKIRKLARQERKRVKKSTKRMKKERKTLSSKKSKKMKIKTEPLS